MDSFNKIEEWLINKFGNEVFTPGLDRIRPYFLPYLKALQIEAKSRVITIAGTNGKGQVSHDLGHLLRLNNSTVCMWTSPHIFNVGERFQFNSEVISVSELVKWIEKSFQDLQMLNGKMSYYEFLFFVFCNWALSKTPDYLILEVGLGGRLDAVNLFDAELVLLPSISRDHQAILGNSYEKILWEKLGVTRKGHQLVSTLELKWLRALSKDYCLKNEIPSLDLFEESLVTDSESYFVRNRKLAIAGFLMLQGDNISAKKIELKLEKLTNHSAGKGRFEKISAFNKEITFVGAHNIDGHRKLIHHYINANKSGEICFDAIVLSFSKRDEDEIKAILMAFLESPCLAKRFVLTAFKHPKAMDGLDQFNCLHGRTNKLIEYEENWDHIFKDEDLAFDNKQGTNTTKRILVTGSYYFIGEVQKYLSDTHSIV